MNSSTYGLLIFHFHSLIPSPTDQLVTCSFRVAISFPLVLTCPAVHGSLRPARTKSLQMSSRHSFALDRNLIWARHPFIRSRGYRFNPLLFLSLVDLCRFGSFRVWGIESDARFDDGWCPLMCDGSMLRHEQNEVIVTTSQAPSSCWSSTVKSEPVQRSSGYVPRQGAPGVCLGRLII